MQKCHAENVMQKSHAENVMKKCHVQCHAQCHAQNVISCRRNVIQKMSCRNVMQKCHAEMSCRKCHAEMSCTKCYAEYLTDTGISGLLGHYVRDNLEVHTLNNHIRERTHAPHQSELMQGGAMTENQTQRTRQNTNHEKPIKRTKLIKKTNRK